MRTPFCLLLRDQSFSRARLAYHGAGLQGFPASVRSMEGPAESALNVSSAGNSSTIRKDRPRGFSRLVCTCPLLSQSTLLEIFC